MQGKFLLWAYVLALIFLGWRSGRRVENQTDYYVNGRHSSWSGVSLSVIASCVGGSAMMGMIGLARDVGAPAFWWLGSGAAGLLILSLFLAKKVRESGAVTMPQMLTEFIGAPSRPLASAIIAVAWLGILAAQFSALAAIIAPLTGMSFFMSLVMGAAAVVLYTAVGGQAAVMKSDILQYLIMLVALLIVLVVGIYHGGAASILAEPVVAVNAAFTASDFTYFMVIIGGSYVVCPMLFGRFLSARDAAAARRGGLWAVFGIAATAVIIVMIGIASRNLVPADTPGEQVLSVFLLHNLPEWAASMVLLGVFSAIVSSADSCLMTAASVISNDLLRKSDINVCRAAMGGLGALAVLLASTGKGILALMLMANDIYVCGVVVPVFVGMLLYKRAAFRPWGMALAIGGGGLLGLIGSILQEPAYNYGALVFALLVSLMSAQFSVSGRLRESSTN